jgi:LPS O-antigen subunit length determinant protein (WzzB/FepE family)
MKLDLNDKLSLHYSISSNNDCSFCEKKSYEVRKIFKGKYATICDECVELCEEIIEEEVEERIKGGIDIRSAEIKEMPKQKKLSIKKELEKNKNESSELKSQNKLIE